MFHLIGVAHRVQSKPKGSDDSEEQKAYRDCLSEAVRRISPVVVGEEFSEHALREAGKAARTGHVSLTKTVADSLGISHRFCDPEPQARREMGYVEGGQLFPRLLIEANLDNEEAESRAFSIEITKYWPLREKYWLEQLVDVADREVIFVCGDAHLESFGALLAEIGIESAVFARRIGLNQGDDAFWSRIMAYLAAHPELRAK